MFYNFEEFCYDVNSFNEIADKHNKATLKDLTDQSNLIKEELKELIDRGIENNNPVEVLDGVIDVLVTSLGLLQQLESLGIDTMGALRATAENNLSKYPYESDVVISTIEMYADKGIKVTSTYNENYDCYVIKNENNKVCKPFGFVSNDVSVFIPEEILKNGFQ
jgi:hypothetical protein